VFFTGLVSCCCASHPSVCAAAAFIQLSSRTIRFQIPCPRHSHAAQIAHNIKIADYSRQHDYPTNVFFPLAAERSGYLHTVFADFIDLVVSRSTNSPPLASHKLQLLYSIAHSITYMTAAFLRSASFQFVPTVVKSLIPPTPFVTPVRWASKILFSKRRAPANSASSSPNGSLRRRAETPAPCESGGQAPALHESGGQGYQGSSEVCLFSLPVFPLDMTTLSAAV